MNMVKQAVRLWRAQRAAPDRGKAGVSMQFRLILFFSLVAVSVILLFALLLMAFGITGSGRQAVYNYTETELRHFADAVGTDTGNLSVVGIDLAGRLSESAEAFFSERGIDGSRLAERPEELEPLLGELMPHLLSVSESNTCGGAFILLDATVIPEDGTHRAGIFVKKTQPVSSSSLPAKSYYLRGPAAVARENGVELLGQWKMEYAPTDYEGLLPVMETARENPELPLSRLYRWTARTRLKDNSEEGFLLCVPLRLADGTVFGLCGVEVSDRMFKLLYSPKESAYQEVFAIAAPVSEDGALRAGQGLIAGNAYLTQNNLTAPLSQGGTTGGFTVWEGGDGAFGGLSEAIRLYPSGSPYAEEAWTVAVLLPKAALDAAVKGSSLYLYGIVILLLVASVGASALVSRKYLQPFHRMFDRVRDGAYEDEGADFGAVDVDEFFNLVAGQIREHRQELERLEQSRQEAESRYEQIQEDISRITEVKKEEIDMEGYRQFLASLHTLTPRERHIFELYADGCPPKEVLARTGFTENTLKFHNKNIYSKLGVSSRKKLQQFAAIMRNDRTLEGGV